VTLGWANAYWQVMQMLFLFFAGTHALNGVRNVLEDYLGRSVWKPILRGLIFLLWMFMMLIAVYVVLAS
jgi:succinate dehydrogenase hydrophobic anchor subunit